MPKAFNFAASPFDCLTHDERQLVRDSVDVAYFRRGETLLDGGVTPSHLFVVIKGFVQQYDADELVATYGPDDCFDARGLMTGRVVGRFVAGEEVLAYQLAHRAVQALITSNATFGALVFSDLAEKLKAGVARHSEHELRSLSMASVEEAFVRPAHYVDGGTDIVSVVRLFHAERIANVLVRDQPLPGDTSGQPRLGIFTASNLQRAILDGRPLDRLPVRELSTFGLVSVKPTDALGDALATMIRHKVHRVLVADGERIVGLLEALDLLSFLANHSYLISRQVAEARTLEALQGAALQIDRLIAILHRSGTRVGQIGRLVQELNAKLFERAWQLVAPPALFDNSCLFVMGSEGRGEQLLKTDQDNGLVLRDGYAPPDDLAAICERFSAALAGFGYPPCPGGVMVSNPAWRMPQSAFAQKVRQWLLMPDGDGLMSLAMFLDSSAVAGDTALLDAVRRELFDLAADNDAMLARFAAAANAFGDGSGFWGRWLSRGAADAEALDLKKIGVFPIVHGARSLALMRRIPATGTAQRLEALAASGDLPRELARDLVESLHFFMGLKLDAGLAQRQAGQPVSGTIDPSRLGSLDRDLMKDALAVVKRFRALLSQRLHLDAV